MIRTRTYTAKLSKTTHHNLDTALRLMGELYNACIEQRESAHRNGHKVLYSDQQKELKDIRSEFPEYQELHAHSTQALIKRVDRAYKRFFRKKGGHPRWKSRNRGVRSIESSLIRVYRGIKWNHVDWKGIGRLRFRGEIPENIRLVRVVRTPLRVKVQIVYDCEPEPVTDERMPIGIDVGIAKLLATSDRLQVAGRKLDRSAIKKKQRTLSNAEKSSNNRKKKGNYIPV